MSAMPVPETYLENAGKFFNNEGQLVKDDLRVVLVHLMESYVKWVFVHARQHETGPGTSEEEVSNQVFDGNTVCFIINFVSFTRGNNETFFYFCF